MNEQQFRDYVRELMAQEQQKLNNLAYINTLIAAIIACVLGAWMSASLPCGGGFAIAAAFIAWQAYAPFRLVMDSQIIGQEDGNFINWHIYIRDSDGIKTRYIGMFVNNTIKLCPY
jgi:hypothetical protein